MSLPQQTLVCLRVKSPKYKTKPIKPIPRHILIGSANWDIKSPRKIHIFLGTPREHISPPRTTLDQIPREPSVTLSKGPPMCGGHI